MVMIPTTNRENQGDLLYLIMSFKLKAVNTYTKTRANNIPEGTPSIPSACLSRLQAFLSLEWYLKNFQNKCHLKSATFINLKLCSVGKHDSYSRYFEK